MKIDDAILLEALIENLKDAFIQLVLCYQSRLYGFAVNLTGNTHEAEDIVQEALLGAYVTLRQYSAARIRELRLQAWLYKLTLNIFRNSRRRLQVASVPLDLSEGSAVAELYEDGEGGLEIFYENEERLEEIIHLIQQLPDYYRIVIVCYYFEEMSQQEIAVLLDQPLGTVKSRLHRGLQTLRRQVRLQEEKERIGYET